MDRLKKGIAVLGVALLGFGFYTGDNLWAFLLGLALVLLCAASSKKLRDYVAALLNWL